MAGGQIRPEWTIPGDVAAAYHTFPLDTAAYRSGRMQLPADEGFGGLPSLVVMSPTALAGPGLRKSEAQLAAIHVISLPRSIDSATNARYD